MRKIGVDHNTGSVSITLDTWTVNTTKAAFLGVTAHWIEIREGRWMV